LVVASRAPRRVTAGPLRVPGQRRVLRLSRRLPQLTALEPAELGVGMSAAQLHERGLEVLTKGRAERRRAARDDDGPECVTRHLLDLQAQPLEPLDLLD